MMENNIPANIPIPPNDGVLTWCDLLSPGSSTKCFFRATWMIDGIARKVNANEVIKANIMSYMLC